MHELTGRTIGANPTIPLRYDGSLANASLPPATGGILPTTSNGPVTRVNFQPSGEAAPAGYLKDAGSVFGVRTNGQTYGWNNGVSLDSRVRRGAVPIPELDTLIHMQKGGPTKKWEYALPNGSYPVIVVAGDPSYRDQTNNLNIEGIQVIDPDPSAPQGYEKGDFDGYNNFPPCPPPGQSCPSERVDSPGASITFGADVGLIVAWHTTVTKHFSIGATIAGTAHGRVGALDVSSTVDVGLQGGAAIWLQVDATAEFTAMVP